MPQDGDQDRFIGQGGVPTLHLIPYRDVSGELVLRLCEDTTGFLIGPFYRRLPRAGIYVSQLRGEAYHQVAAGPATSPGRARQPCPRAEKYARSECDRDLRLERSAPRGLRKQAEGDDAGEAGRRR